MKREKFAPEFKAKLVLRVLQEEKEISEIAKIEGISVKILSEWKKEFIEKAAMIFDENKKSKMQDVDKSILETINTENDNRLRNFIEIFSIMENSLNNEATAYVTDLAPLSDVKATTKLGPRFPADPFSYNSQLDLALDFPVKTQEEYNRAISRCFRGVVRPASPNFLLNIHPEPDIEATAAACLAIYHNLDGLMDEFSGEALLVEQQIIKKIGSWAGWSNATGTATAGGKITTLYALRSALARISSSYLKDGIPEKTIIITSAGAHYSLQHSVSIIGLGTNNCWSVPMDDGGKMRLDAFINALRRAWENGYTVAAIICCGGSTIDFHCDDLKNIYAATMETLKKYPGMPVPYFHVDAVIGWQYLAFAEFNEQEISDLKINSIIKNRIFQAVQRLSGISEFDSFGADFHKNGQCPITSSFFVARDSQFMNDLSIDKQYNQFGKVRFGSHRPYRYTIENSRSLHGVMAAWSILNRFGGRGITKYLLELHSAREAFELAIERDTYLEKLPNSSLGWEVVFSLRNDEENSPNNTRSNHNQDFADYCLNLVYYGYNIPLISTIPSGSDCRLLIYPMRNYSIEEASEIIKTISTLWKNYCSTKSRKGSLLTFSDSEAPIR